MSDSLQPHGLWPARLLCPWNFPDKNTGVGCHFLLQGIIPDQGSNLCLLHLLYWWRDSLLLETWEAQESGLQDRNLFLTVLKAGNSKVRVPARLCSGESSLWITDSCLLAVSLPGRELELGLVSLLLRAIIPLWRATLSTPSVSNYLSKPHLQLHQGLRLQPLNLGETQFILLHPHVLTTHVHVLPSFKILPFHPNIPQTFNWFQQSTLKSGSVFHLNII